MEKGKSECSCGEMLNYIITPYVALEQRICPKCGKINYVDNCPVDIDKAVKTKIENYQEIHEHEQEPEKEIENL